MFLAPVASQYWMAKPTPANTKDDYDKKRCADQLRRNRNMQSGNQIVAIRHFPTISGAIAMANRFTNK